MYVAEALNKFAASRRVRDSVRQSPASMKFCFKGVKVTVGSKRKGVIVGNAWAKIVDVFLISGGVGSIHGTIPRKIVSSI